MTNLRGEAVLMSDLDRYDSKYFEKRRRAYLETAVKKFAFEVLLKAEELFGLELTGGIGGRAIDVGCAQGYVVELLQKLGYEACGIDVSSIVEKTQARNSLVRASWTHMAFKKESFDLVTAFEVIEHLPNHEEVLMALSETFHVLRAGGVFIFTTPTRNPITLISDRLHREFHHVLQPPFYWHSILSCLSSRVAIIPFLSIPFGRFSIFGRFYWINLPSVFARHVMVFAIKDVD